MEKLIEIEELKIENKQLEQDLYIALNKIDKAIEYIKMHKEYQLKYIIVDTKELLEILGDKENE